MYNIEIGETRANAEEYLGRIHDLVLKQKKVLKVILKLSTQAIWL